MDLHCSQIQLFCFDAKIRSDHCFAKALKNRHISANSAYVLQLFLFHYFVISKFRIKLKVSQYFFINLPFLSLHTPPICILMDLYLNSFDPP